MREVSVKEVFELLDLAVADRGEDFVYEKSDTTFCMNFHGDEPGCIVGWVFHHLGVTGEQATDCQANKTDARTAYYHLGGTRQFNTSEDGLDVLLCAQSYQDAGDSWGKSVAKARTWASLRPRLKEALDA